MLSNVSTFCSRTLKVFKLECKNAIPPLDLTLMQVFCEIFILFCYGIHIH